MVGAITGGDSNDESVVMELFLVAEWLGRVEPGNCWDGKLLGGVLDDRRGGIEARVEETVRVDGVRGLIEMGCMDIDIEVSMPYGEGAKLEGDGA